MFKLVARVVTRAAGIVSNIPGPVGSVASAIAVTGYLAEGNFARAASYMPGLVPGGKLFSLASRMAKGGVLARNVARGYAVERMAHFAIRTRHPLSRISYNKNHYGLRGRPDFVVRGRMTKKIKRVYEVKSSRAKLSRYQQYNKLKQGRRYKILRWR